MATDGERGGEGVGVLEGETNYYNLVPYPERETDEDCIYDVITEQRQLHKPATNNQLMRDNNQPPADNNRQAEAETKPVVGTKPPFVNFKQPVSEVKQTVVPVFVNSKQPALEKKPTLVNTKQLSNTNSLVVKSKQENAETKQPVVEGRRPVVNIKSFDTKPPLVSVKPFALNSSKTEIKPKFEEKKLSPFVSNMTTIFNKPFVKPQLREIKPPILSKSYQ